MENIGRDLLDFQRGSGAGTPFHRVINTEAEENLTIEQRSLDKVISGSYFVIPEYQRGYQWSEDEFKDLWGDLIELLGKDFSEERKASDVFFGSMFFAKTEEYNNDTSKDTLEVIDGQQRLTSVFVLLKLIKDRLNEYEDDLSFDELSYDHRGFISEINGIDQDISLYSGAGTPDDPAMLLNDYNRDFFSSLVKGKEELVNYILAQDSVHNNTKHNAITYKEYGRKLGIKSKVSEKLDNHEDDLDDKVSFNKTNKQLMELYYFFDQRLDTALEERFNSVNEKATALVNLKRYLFNNYQVGYFDVEKDSSELLMKIFRVLNDRGMDLKKMDIIKTRIYSFFEEEDDRKIWKDVIEEFDANHNTVEDFITDYFFVNESGSYTRSKISKNLLQAFERDSREESTLIDSKLTDEKTAREFLDEVSLRASYYHDIIEPFQRGISLNNEALEEECNRILIRLDNLGTKQWQPLAMSMYTEVKESDAPERKLKNALDQIEKISLRFMFTDLNPNIMEKVYAEVGEEFRKREFESDPERQLREKVKSETDEMTGSDFVDNLIGSGIRSKKAKQLYRRMASSDLLDNDTEELIVQKLNRNDNVVQIEHIFPQSPKGVDGEYTWVRDFFFTDNGYGLEESEELQEILEELIEQDQESQIEGISDQFIQDFANMVLLHGEDNKIASNKPFEDKKDAYEETNYFEQLPQNSYLRDSESWNFKKMTERKKELVDHILESLKMEEDEFELVNVEEKVEEETKRRIKVMAANNSGIIE